MMLNTIRGSVTNVLERIWRILTDAHPSVVDISERRRSRLLSIISLVLSGFFAWALLSNPTSLSTFTALIITTVISYILSRTRYYQAGAYLFSYGFSSLSYISLFFGTASSFSASITTTGHVAIIISSILLSLRGFSILMIISIIATFTAPLYSHFPIPFNETYFRDAGVFTVIGVILYGAIAFRDKVEQERLKKLLEVNTEFEYLAANLEQRVMDRTMELLNASKQTSQRSKQLQAITELSETIAELRDLNKLFPAVTNLISEGFGFYHVGLFLVDSDRKFAILQAANSEGGKVMLSRGHRLEFGSGVVGYAAQTGQPRIALDVGADAVFFNNPELPNTRSEAALPLKSRDETIGVLDMQSTEAGAFSDEDLQVLTALANQVSIAFENARLLTETRAALAQVQEVYGEFTRTEWTRTVSNAQQPGFRYQSGRIEILENVLQSPDVVSAVESGQIVANPVDGPSEKRATLVVPVKLRGEVIGVLHIESDSPSSNWNDDEISLVEAVAERAALAMENARLFQEARRRASKEQLISEVSAKIGSSINIENILQTTAEELERVLGGSEVLIQFQGKEAQK